MTTTEDRDTTTVYGPALTGFTPPETEAPQRDSPLGSLKARRAKQQEKLFLDLLVPGWHEDPDDPAPISVYVRCTPARPSSLARAMETRRKQKKQHRNWLELANADVLVECCVGVFALEGQPAEDTTTDERPKLSLRDGDEHGDWTRFDSSLAASLGLDSAQSKAVDVVMALFPTEAGVITAVNELARWSGVERPKDQEDFFSD